MKRAARLWLIELLAYWEGKINTRPIQQRFKLSRQSCSELFRHYRSQNPDNLCYDRHLKAYVLGEHFKARYIDQSVDEYLNWLCYQTLPAPADREPPNISMTRLAPPRRYVSPVIMRSLILAMREKQRIDIEYLSVASSDPEGRIIAPHSLVKTATRWHVRAWCEKRQQFLDFVLSRFKGQPVMEGPAQYHEADDEIWNTWVDIEVAPDQRLSPAQKQIIEADFGMVSGKLVLPTRAPLVKYTLDDMQIKTKMIEARPEAQQLVCVNYNDIKQWLFE